MSGTAATPAGPGADPSMEDILASIRRILSEDESTGAAMAAAPVPPPAPPAAQPPAPPPQRVLTLDSTMMVRPPAPAATAPAPALLASLGTMMTPAAAPPPAPAPSPPPAPIFAMHPVPEVAPVSQPSVSNSHLVAPEAAAAASASIGQLMRTLTEAHAQQVNATAAEAQAVVYRGGPTLEDLAREAMRPMLKAWLDANLPAMVETLVRAEIARVVGRAVS